VVRAGGRSGRRSAAHRRRAVDRRVERRRDHNRRAIERAAVSVAKVAEAARVVGRGLACGERHGDSGAAAGWARGGAERDDGRRRVRREAEGDAAELLAVESELEDLGHGIHQHAVGRVAEHITGRLVE